jgi:hypothetical protein
MDTPNLVILIIQIMILLIEVVIAFKAYCSSRKSERGIFLLNPHGDGIGNPHFKKDYFNLDNMSYRYLRLVLHNANTILLDYRVEINGVNKEINTVNINHVFALDDEENGFAIDLDLNQNILDSGSFDCKVILSLCTLSNYKYKEEIEMKFIKEPEESYWFLKKILPKFVKN